MDAGVIYKVLWVDDQSKDENGNNTALCESLQLKAGEYNIDIDAYDNWEDAESVLKREFDEYTAIILDANCKIYKQGTEREEFITAILPSLNQIFGEKQKLLPWYILSAGTMSNFSGIVNGASHQHSKHKEEWGNMLYLKHVANDDEKSSSELFKNIARVAKELPNNVILYRHYDTFRYLGEDKQIDLRARKYMLRMLSAIYYPEEDIYDEYEGNSLRKVLEYIFWSAYRYGLLPDECIDKEKKIVILQHASLFMAGANVNGNKYRWGNPGPLKDGKGGDAIFTTEIANIVKNILYFTNKCSHAQKRRIDKKNKELFFSYVLQMCHVIKWFGNYVEKHPDNLENKKMHVYINSVSNYEKDKKFGVQKENILNEKCQVLQGNNLPYLGECKFSDEYKTSSTIGCQIKVLEIEENEGKDKNEYPFIITKMEICVKD